MNTLLVRLVVSQTCSVGSLMAQLYPVCSGWKYKMIG